MYRLNIYQFPNQRVTKYEVAPGGANMIKSECLHQRLHILETDVS